MTNPGPDFRSWSPEQQDTPHCSPSAWKERASPEAVGRWELLGSAVCRPPHPATSPGRGSSQTACPLDPDHGSPCGCSSGSSAGHWRVLRRLCCHLQFTQGPQKRLGNPGEALGSPVLSVGTCRGSSPPAATSPALGCSRSRPTCGRPLCLGLSFRPELGHLGALSTGRDTGKTCDSCVCPEHNCSFSRV